MSTMAVLTVMVSIATQAIAVSAAAMLAAYTISTRGRASRLWRRPEFCSCSAGWRWIDHVGVDGDGAANAAMFFNGTLGQFAANSSFGTVGRNTTGQKSDLTQGTFTAEAGSGGRAQGAGTRY